MSNQLAGKAVLVTGGSRSIGAVIAKRLAADGAAVALTYSTSPKKAEEVGAHRGGWRQSSGGACRFR